MSLEKRDESPLGEVNRSTATVHGVFLNVAGVGTLIIGESGLGKSECALELVSHGHVLIADDAVEIERTEDHLYGESPDLLSGLLEIRGLGVIDVRQMFGAAAIGEKQEIELCIEFHDRNPENEDDRIAAEMPNFELLGLKLPKFVIAVGAGRPLALLVETAVKLFVLRRSGFDTERDLIATYNNAIAAQKA